MARPRVIAERVFHHDQGKLKPGAFEGDLWVHSLSDAWLRAAQDLAGPAEGLHGYVTADDEAGRWWFLEQLLAKRDPLRVQAVADAAALAFPDNTIFRRYRGT